MTIRRPNKVRLILLAVTGAALTGLMASKLLPSKGKQAPSRAEWVEVGVATDGTKAFVNRLSITDTGPRVALWQRFALGTAKAQGGAARAVEQLVIYDCRTRIFSTLESRELAGTGTLLRTQRFNPPPQDRVRPGSLPEYIYDSIC